MGQIRDEAINIYSVIKVLPGERDEIKANNILPVIFCYIKIRLIIQIHFMSRCLYSFPHQQTGGSIYLWDIETFRNIHMGLK